MASENTVDPAAAARHERFGRLPDRVPYKELVEETAGTPKALASPYDPEGSWLKFSCVAADLGL